MWCVECDCFKEILEPLGLYSNGGGDKNNELSYNIWSKEYGLICELTENEIKNIFEQKEIQFYLRKIKINNVLRSSR